MLLFLIQKKIEEKVRRIYFLQVLHLMIKQLK